MKIIFDWSAVFHEEKNNWRGDEEIIALEIFQKECGFAMAKVSIGAKNSNDLLNKKYAKIGIQRQGKVDLLFSGRLVAFPVGFSNSTMEIELIAEPDDYQMKLREFSGRNFNLYRSVNKHEKERGHILFDDLFFSSNDLKNPTIFLEGDNKIFYWNMKNGELSLSDINCGRKNFDVSGNEILQNSIRIRIAREPYGVVNLKLSASWIQQEYGIIDLMPIMAREFDRHLINSFTNIKSGIENIFSEKKGYKLAHCDIREMNSTDVGETHPVLSPNFYVQENESADRKKVLFKRFYFDGKLILHWAYKQKRVEVVNIKIINSSSPGGREKNVYLRLNAIQSPKKYQVWNHFTYYGYGDKIQRGEDVWKCKSPHVSDENFEMDKWDFEQKIPDAMTDETSSSFFVKTRGKNAIKYAMQKAIALINYSSRYIEIDFCVEAKKFMAATVDDQITIRDRRFKNGFIAGKIIRTTFSGNADHRIMKFTIGCCDSDQLRNFEKLNSYEIEIADDDSKINPADIVKNIEIKNKPEEQISILSSKAARNVSELQNELKKHPTKIKVSLHPLNTSRVITREITLPSLALNVGSDRGPGEIAKSCLLDVLESVHDE
ncbi:MAG: hypothetical protein LBQ08_03320 [Holosporaceae bacterium]|jgi:hypothetical protein|nr:hypothetical protein [Holosporaceae bacterium]